MMYSSCAVLLSLPAASETENVAHDATQLQRFAYLLICSRPPIWLCLHICISIGCDGQDMQESRAEMITLHIEHPWLGCTPSQSK